MSFARLVYYSGVIGGWSALLGWLLSEVLVFRASAGSRLSVVIVGGLVGAAVGVGLNLVAGMANAQWKQLLLRALPGLIGGGIGGAVGGLLGDTLYSLGVPRAFGWMIVGIGIGVVDGAYERSKSKIRNGLIGGSIGGLLGGFLFDPIQSLISSNSGMSSRATAFVILGICIGNLIGVAQVVLKEAWLTVLDGYRSGRQLILSRTVTVLGRGDHLALPFMGVANKDLNSEHVKITRRTDGSFIVEDLKSKLGTRLNNQPLAGQAQLKNGDVIKFGPNFVRFNERMTRDSAAVSTAPQAFSGQVATAPPPPKRAATPPAKTEQPAAKQPAAAKPATPPTPRPLPPAAKPATGIRPPPPPPGRKNG